MSKRPASLWQHVQNLLSVAGLGWLFWMGAHGLWKVLHTGTIRNWRGPDIGVSENPLVFWALSGFFGLGIILVGALAVFCILIATNSITRK